MITIILVAGKIGSGKTELSKNMKEYFMNEKGLNCVKMSFATPLKDLCKEAFRPMVDQLNDILKEYPSFQTTEDNWYQNKNWLTRNILQTVGTDIARKLDPDCWVRLAAEDLMKEYEKNYLDKDLIVIFDDVRFLNEFHIARKLDEILNEDMKLIKIKMVRETTTDKAAANHTSENQLNDYNGWNYEFSNDGDLEDLNNDMIEMLKKLNLD